MTAGTHPPTGLVRVGGRWTVGGITTTWSVSDGSRGRRWRATSTGEAGSTPEAAPTADSGFLAYALETDPRGGFVKIEAATAGALLTLHREADDSLHGHVVRDAGIEHLALGSLAMPAVLVEGELLAASALASSLRGLRGADASGREVRLRLARITRGLDVSVVDASIERVAPDRFRVKVAGLAALELVVDDRGLPVVPGGSEWPLER